MTGGAEWLSRLVWVMHRILLLFWWLILILLGRMKLPPIHLGVIRLRYSVVCVWYIIFHLDCKYTRILINICLWGFLTNFRFDITNKSFQENVAKILCEFHKIMAHCQVKFLKLIINENIHHMINWCRLCVVDHVRYYLATILCYRIYECHNFQEIGLGIIIFSAIIRLLLPNMLYC